MITEMCSPTLKRIEEGPYFSNRIHPPTAHWNLTLLFIFIHFDQRSSATCETFTIQASFYLPSRLTSTVKVDIWGNICLVIYCNALIWSLGGSLDVKSAYQCALRNKIKGMREVKAGSFFFLPFQHVSRWVILDPYHANIHVRETFCSGCQCHQSIRSSFSQCVLTPKSHLIFGLLPWRCSFLQTLLFVLSYQGLPLKVCLLS